jgi:hypothetical protein
MARLRNIRPSLAVLALVMVAVAVVAGTFAAFVSLASNQANSFESGTVSISDNDAGSALLSLIAAKPGDSDTGCIEVTYGGSLDSTVHLYANVSGALAPYLTLTVTRGTDSKPFFDSCDFFSADETDYIGSGPGVVYSGALSAYPGGYDDGIVDAVAGAEETWTTSEVHSYRFVVSVNDDNAAQGLSSLVDFQWEARNL